MRSTDIIRNVLDLIDNIDEVDTENKIVDCEQPVGEHGDDPNRFLQIVDLLTSEYNQMYDNSPVQMVAGINAVTDHAGGGWNGPKHPADMRADSVAMYPAFQARL